MVAVSWALVAVTNLGGTFGCAGILGLGGEVDLGVDDIDGSGGVIDMEGSGAACSAMAPCKSGCCSGGRCAGGSLATACGSSGACVDCTSATTGSACRTNGACGCDHTADCPALTACNTTTHQCESACSSTQPCSGGCCSAMVAGTCMAGDSSSVCGDPGTVCFDCSSRSTGTRCMTGSGTPAHTCGCTAKEDCPIANPAGGVGGYACDVANASCTTLCGLTGVTACNGGCCSGMNGHCSPGNADTACGISGAFCSNCAATCSPGPACNVTTGACGCSMGMGQCNISPLCTMNNANRFGCNLGTAACCVPGIYNFPDNGNPAGCCSGASTNGQCTCLPDGSAVGNPAVAYACCSLDVDMNGKCKCVPNGMSADLGNGAVAAACCSNTLSGSNCVCAAQGGACQSNAGCCSGTCSNGVCA